MLRNIEVRGTRYRNARYEVPECYVILRYEVRGTGMRCTRYEVPGTGVRGTRYDIA